MMLALLPARLVLANESLDPNADNESCFSCHDDSELSMERDGSTVSLHVDQEVYNATPHRVVACIRCHEEITETPSQTGEAHPEQVPYGREARITISERCTKCHRGLIEESYNKSFHGAAVQLGSTTAATCVDCHGVHNILPASDPESMVAKENLPDMCGDCHPGAGPGIAEGEEHVVPGKAGNPFLGYLLKFFIALILFDTLKDGPIVIFELIHRLHRDFQVRQAPKGGQ